MSIKVKQQRKANLSMRKQAFVNKVTQNKCSRQLFDIRFWIKNEKSIRWYHLRSKLCEHLKNKTINKLFAKN